MFCPQCRDEFRPGFSRCGRCNVDLVESLTADRKAVPSDAPGPVRLGEYCGFLSLDEARSVRDLLRERRIRSEIAVREPLDASWDEPVQEEFWLRVDVARLREVEAVVGGMPEVEETHDVTDPGFACGGCGHHVAENETVCPECGARFDD